MHTRSWYGKTTITLTSARAHTLAIYACANAHVHVRVCVSVGIYYIKHASAHRGHTHHIHIHTHTHHPLRAVCGECVRETAIQTHTHTHTVQYYKRANDECDRINAYLHTYAYIHTHTHKYVYFEFRIAFNDRTYPQKDTAVTHLHRVCMCVCPTTLACMPERVCVKFTHVCT